MPPPLPMPLRAPTYIPRRAQPLARPPAAGARRRPATLRDGAAAARASGGACLAPAVRPPRRRARLSHLCTNRTAATAPRRHRRRAAAPARVRALSPGGRACVQRRPMPPRRRVRMRPRCAADAMPAWPRMPRHARAAGAGRIPSFDFDEDTLTPTPPGPQRSRTRRGRGRGRGRAPAAGLAPQGPIPRGRPDPLPAWPARLSALLPRPVRARAPVGAPRGGSPSPHACTHTPRRRRRRRAGADTRLDLMLLLCPGVNSCKRKLGVLAGPGRPGPQLGHGRGQRCVMSAGGGHKGAAAQRTRLNPSAPDRRDCKWVAPVFGKVPPSAFPAGRGTRSASRKAKALPREPGRPAGAMPSPSGWAWIALAALLVASAAPATTAAPPPPPPPPPRAAGRSPVQGLPRQHFLIVPTAVSTSESLDTLRVVAELAVRCAPRSRRRRHLPRPTWQCPAPPRHTRPPDPPPNQPPPPAAATRARCWRWSRSRLSMRPL
jgi:hypothetical protein